MAIERGKRNVLTSSTATISRMGVVSPTIPDVSGLTNMVSKSIANIAETQAKAIDSEYITNFDINTTRFVSDKTNAILNSTEEPDIERYQKELESYYSAIEKDAPQRLKNQIQQKFYNLYLNGLDHVKGHANKVKFNKAAETFELWKLNTMDYISNEVNNIIKTKDKSIWFDSLNQLFAKDGSADLFKGNPLHENVVALSGGKLNKADTEIANKEFMAEIESIRVNSILKMMAMSDPDNFEELGNQFLLEYKNNENNRRAIKYEVYGGLSNQVVDEVVKIGRSELTTLVNLHKDSEANKVALGKLQLLNNYHSYKNGIKDLTNGYVVMNNENKPMTSYDFAALGFSNTQAIELERLNNSKLQITSLLREAKISNTPLAQLLENSSYQDAISDLGGKDEIIKQYYETDLGFKDDIASYQTDINDLNLQNMLVSIQKNQVAPPGYIAFLNSSTNEPFIRNANFTEVKEAIQMSFPTWNVATDGGKIDIKNIPADVHKVMKEVLFQQEAGFTYDQIANNLQKDFNLSGTEKAQKTKKTDRFLEQNPIDVTERVYTAYQSMNKYYNQLFLNNRDVIGTSDNIVEGFAPMLPTSWWQDALKNEGIDILTAPMAGFKSLNFINRALDELAAANFSDDFEDEYMSIYETIFRNSVSFNDNDEALKKKSEAASFETLKTMAGMGYGYSKYMSPDGKGSFQKYAIESVNQMQDVRQLRNTGAAFVLNEIINYEKAGEIEELKNMGFVDEDYNYVRPTADQIIDMWEDGKFYFVWDGNEPSKVNGKASNVRYDIFYNNYEDLEGRASAISSKPIFQYDIKNKFIPNYYTSDLNIDRLKQDLATDAVELLPEDAPVRQFITKYSALGTGYIWDFLTKIAPGERNNIFDSKMVNDLAILEADLDFKIGKEIRFLEEGKPYETDKDKLDLFDTHYRNVNIATSGSVDPIPFDVDKATAIINEVDKTFEEFDGFTKTVISEVLYSMEDINKNELFKAINKRDYKKIEKLIGQKKANYIKGMLYTPEVLQ